MKQEVRFACPLDCFDACGLTATVLDGRITNIRGDRHHPLTRGSCCRKGRQLAERLYHPRRLSTPLRRVGDRWEQVSWQAAVAEIADRLQEILAEDGSPAILHYAGSGHGGLLKKADSVFFNHLGGVTVPRGSLCWGAGIAAQRYDFGKARGHHPEDLGNARTILIWGRNPAATNLHLLPALQKARDSGARIFLIDPRCSASAAAGFEHLAVRPATDAALALGMAGIIVENGFHDRDFIQKRVHGFDAFRETLSRWTPERTEAVTGIPRQTIRRLAECFARFKPSAIIVGMGLQRYANGGSTVRCIDALGALTGNIGISGGGVSYANQAFGEYIGGPFRDSALHAHRQRTFSIAHLGRFLDTEANPPIRCIFITKANPLVQGPDINRTAKAFAAVPFKVVIDPFMTDTARQADLVLPCTGVLEEEDIVYSNMFSPWMTYSAKAVAPPDGVMSEYAFFQVLADRMGLTGFPRLSAREFLAAAIQPLTEAFGVDLTGLQQAPFCLPDSGIPWREGGFATASGKYELYSEAARTNGLNPLPDYIPAAQGDTEYPLRLITPHWKNSMHSQHFAFIDGRPEARAAKTTLERQGFADGDRARLRSVAGELEVIVRGDKRLPEGLVTIYQGWWHKNGSVNRLTTDRISDMGEQAAFYDCFVRLEPASDESS